MTFQITYQGIGVIHSPFSDLAQMPIQPTTRVSAPGTADVFLEFAQGLKDLEGFSHVILLYHFHESHRMALTVTPLLSSELKGIFATRAPIRPNPIGLSIVKLLRIEGDAAASGEPRYSRRHPTPGHQTVCAQIRPAAASPDRVVEGRDGERSRYKIRRPLRLGTKR